MKRRLLALMLCVVATYGQSVSVGASSGVTPSNVLPNLVSFNGPTGTCGGSCVVGAGTTMTITAPATITTGNALIIFISIGGATSETFTFPSGFAQVGSTLTSTANGKVQIAAACKTATSSEPGSYTVTWTNNTNLGVGWVTNIANGSCTNDGIGTAVGNAANLTASTFLPASSQDLLMVFASQNSNGTVPIFSVPAHGNTTSSNNGNILGNIPWGSGTSPGAKVAWTLSGNANTNDSAIMVIAVPTTKTTTATPSMLNSNSAAGTLNSLNVTGGLYAVGTIESDNSFILGPAANLSAIHPTKFNIERLISINGAGNMILDTDGTFTFISTFGGSRGGPDFLLSSGRLFAVSFDLSQDLYMANSTANNDLIFGCFVPGCSGANEQKDVVLNAQTAQSLRFQNNAQDELWMNGSGFVGGVPIVQAATPSAPTVAPTCPSCANNATWGYKVCAVDANGGLTPCSAETQIVNTQNATLDGTHFNDITWTQVAGTKSYKVFRSTAATSPATTGVIATVLSTTINNGQGPTTLTFRDNNVAGDSSTAQATNTTGTIKAVGYQLVNSFASTTTPVCTSGTCCGGTAASIVASNGTQAFEVNVGTGPAAGGCTITMPSATTGWNCDCSDLTTTSTTVFYCKQTGAVSQTSVVLQNFSDVAAATAFTASDHLRVKCASY